MVQEFQTHFLSCLSFLCLSVFSHMQDSVSINSSNGQLSVDHPLDHELADSYRLLVGASSGGVQATTLVVITVENVNEQPLFTRDMYKVCIMCVLLYLTDLWLHGFMHCTQTCLDDLDNT